MFPAGDAFVVYPGQDGPVDSMRWEVFAEGLADYALLQTAGVDRESQTLSDLRSFEDFPRGPAWLDRRRRRILQALARRQGPRARARFPR
jgi:hypothetical protein